MIKKLWNMFVNRETITYVIAGVLTTLVNFVTTFLFYNGLHWDKDWVTAIAWAVAVLFAYLINKYWVFQEKREEKVKEVAKLGKFVAGRLFTLAVEWLGIFFLVPSDENASEFWPVKIILAVVVTVLNYIISKLFVFISKPEKKEKR